MKDVLENILHSPLLPEYSERIQAKLSEEAQRRAKFYEEITEEHKWEFIDGQVVLHSPAKNCHLCAVMNATALLNSYVRLHNLGAVRTEKCLCKFPRNDYEPDVVYFGRAKAAGFDAVTMLFPTPDLVVEVLSESTEERDRGVKFQDYERHVPEYWIVDADTETVEQYVKRESGYWLRLKAANGDLICEAIEGLVIPVRAFFEEVENFSFVRKLSAQAAPP